MVGPIEQGPNTKIRIVIAEDSAAMAQTIMRILSDYPHFDIMALTSTGQETVSIVEEYMPNVLILDLGLPDMNGLDVIRQLRENPETKKVKIIIVTVSEDSGSVAEAIRWGVEGYIFKMTGLDLLVQALANVNRGHTYYDSEVMRVVNMLYPADILYKTI